MRSTNWISERVKIGARLRDIRKSHQMTQAELAAMLDISQPRLSGIERGQYSLTAEQMLHLLKIFNIDTNTFAGDDNNSQSLQNALVRFGARHLREYRSVLPDSRLSTPVQAIIEVLLEPSSKRHVASLCPILVWSIDEIAPNKIQHLLAQTGLLNRFPWLVENTLIALSEVKEPQSRDWRLRWRRARVVLSTLGYEPDEDALLDSFDTGIRSQAGFDRVWQRASETSTLWRIISTLTEDDFSHALARASDV